MSRRGWLLFGLMALIWGIPYLLIKIAIGGVSAPDVVFCRTAVGALVLLPIAIRGGRFLVNLRENWLPLLLFAICEIIGPWWLLSDAERKLPSSLTGLLIAAVPIISALLALRGGTAEQLGPLRWFGLLLGLAGVAVLAVPHLGGGDALSIGEVILTAIGYGIAPRIAATRLRDVPAAQVTASCLALAAILYATPAVLTRPKSMPGVPVLIALAGLAVICTAVAFVVFFRLIAEAGPVRAMVFTYVNPVVSVVAGALVLHEPITALTIGGFAQILIGSLLATGRIRPKTDPPADSVTPVELGGPVAG